MNQVMIIYIRYHIFHLLNFWLMQRVVKKINDIVIPANAGIPST